MKLDDRYYRTDLEDGAEDIFRQFVMDTNAINFVSNPDMNYIVTEEEVPVVYEIRDANGNYSATRALVLEDTVVEGQLVEEKVEEVRDWYRNLAHSNSSS